MDLKKYIGDTVDSTDEIVHDRGCEIILHFKSGRTLVIDIIHANEIQFVHYLNGERLDEE